MGVERFKTWALWFSLFAVLSTLLFLAMGEVDFAAEDKVVSPFQLPVDQTINIDCPIAQKPCAVRMGTLSMQVSLSPKNLPALQALTLTISDLSEHMSRSSDWLVWLEGRDMDMGRHVLNRLVSEESSSQDRLLFGGMIPVCTVDSHMTWLLNVQFANNGQRYRLVLAASTV